LLARRSYVTSEDFVWIWLQVIITGSNEQGSRLDLVELDETINNLQRKVKSYRAGNKKLIKDSRRVEPN